MQSALLEEYYYIHGLPNTYQRETPMTAPNLAQTAYDAYCHSSGGKSLISGAPLPPFGQLKPEIQTAWAAAAHAVIDELANRRDSEGNADHG